MTKNHSLSGLDKFNKISKTSNALLNILLIVLCLLILFPIVFLVVLSISDENSIRQYGYLLIPKSFSMEGFNFLFKQRTAILKALGISLFTTIVGTVIGVMLNTTMGYAMSRKDYKLSKVLSWVVIIPMLFNGGMFATYVIVANMLHLKDSIWALILPLCVSSFNVIVCRTFFKQTVPDALIESAKIDGATQFRIFRSIVLPISLPVLATIALFLMFAYWNDWYQSKLYINDKDLFSLQALLDLLIKEADFLAKNAGMLGGSYAEIARTMPKESSKMAIGVIIVLPIACAYPFFQRYFISGLTIGAVKE